MHVNTKKSYFILLFSTFTFQCISASEDVIVRTKFGDISGFTHNTEDGFEASAFLGVPYAKPPLGDYRFEVHFYLKNLLSNSQNIVI